MDPAGIPAWTETIRYLLEAPHLATEHVRKVAPPKRWSGKADVEVFETPGGDGPMKVYAWSGAVKGTNRRRFFAVMGVGVITSAATAVRAASWRMRRSLVGDV